MKYLLGIGFGRFLLLILLLSGGYAAVAQVPVSPGATSMSNKTTKDTSKTNTNKWKNEEAHITYQRLNSARVYIPDSALHNFQRPPFLQPWYRDLGNLGSPVNNLFFTPEDRLGPTLGYHVFDVYRYNVDELNFYTTNHPYSVFTYELGSKLEQTAGIMHTQNIKPNWNFAVQYRKINSPGFYKIQRNNNDNANLTTNYKSLNKHYVLYAAMVYNMEQHDENGGLLNMSQLTNSSYSDRKTLDVPFQNDLYSTTRSSVFNDLRDFTFLLQHSYIFGRTDTTYNEDSTHYTYKLKPVFGITHKMEISTEKHSFKDLAPDSARYANLFTQSFTNNGSGYYTIGGDSVFNQQKWFWVDNKVMLNGFLGKTEHPLLFSAGLGNRYDQFTADPVTSIHYDTLHRAVYTIGKDKTSMVSNYFTGEIKKEALYAGQWEYGVNTKFFLTGPDAGNFVLNASMGRELKKMLGSFVMGFSEHVNTAPYAYTNYENIYTKQFFSFTDENITTLYATLESPRFRLSGGVRNYVIGNYIFVNDSERPAQYLVPFDITQGWIRKVFKMGNVYLDNELVYQQIPVNAPVNIPAFMGRHQLSLERSLFKGALKTAIGIEVRYNSTYHPAGYDALLNRFFYQATLSQSNVPEESVFVNFRVKRFRAFVMAENLQQLLFSSNTILFTGTPTTATVNGVTQSFVPVYAAPDLLIRFGFTWVLVN